MIINLVNIHNQTFCLGTHTGAHSAEATLVITVLINSLLQGHSGAGVSIQIQECLLIWSR